MKVKVRFDMAVRTTGTGVAAIHCVYMCASTGTEGLRVQVYQRYKQEINTVSVSLLKDLQNSIMLIPSGPRA